MQMSNWLDSILWAISRAYRRRKIKHSHVYTELRAPIRPDAEALDRALERPAILTIRDAHGAAERPYRFNRTQELLIEKLTDEAMMHGSWSPSGQAMEYWCEHCPQYGACCVCGQTHERTI